MSNQVIEPLCEKCGSCCRLFLINLSKEEYFSGKYNTVFQDMVSFDDFEVAEMCGANILSTMDSGACCYLEGNRCSIHEKRPEVCRKFFCADSGLEHKAMREVIKIARREKEDNGTIR